MNTGGGVGPLVLDPVGNVATLDGVPLALTPGDFKLLFCVAKHADAITPYSEVYAAMGYERRPVNSHAANEAARRLRKKLKGSPLFLRTITGVGFRLELKA